MGRMSPVKLWDTNIKHQPMEAKPESHVWCRRVLDTFLILCMKIFIIFVKKFPQNIKRFAPNFKRFLTLHGNLCRCFCVIFLTNKPTNRHGWKHNLLNLLDSCDTSAEEVVLIFSESEGHSCYLAFVWFFTQFELRTRSRLRETHEEVRPVRVRVWTQVTWFKQMMQGFI